MFSEDRRGRNGSPPPAGRPRSGGQPTVHPAALGLALWIVAVAVAYGARTIVASEWLSDPASLAVTLATALALAAAALIALRLAMAGETRRSRVAAALFPLGFLLVFAGFARASLPDASVEMEAIVEAHGAQDPAAVIELGPRGDDVRLTGEIAEGAARRLAALLDANPRVGRIHLTSEGGLADEGQALGDVIAAHRLVTYVPDYCVSACTLAFVRGRQRLVLDDARVGFHSPFEQGLFGAIYTGDSSDQRAAYLAAGLTPDFVDAALKVAPEDVWYPPVDRLIAAKVATDVVPRDRFPDSNLDGAATLEGARDALLRNYPILAAFRQRSPAALETIAAWYLDAYRSEKPEAENVERLGTIVRGAVATAMTRADDRTLAELARFLRRGMSAAPDAETCARIGGELDLVEAEQQLGRDDSKADAQAVAILSAAEDGHRRPKRAARRGEIAGVFDVDDDDRECRAEKRLFDKLAGGTPAETAAILRVRADAVSRRSLSALASVTGSHDGAVAR